MQNPKARPPIGRPRALPTPACRPVITRGAVRDDISAISTVPRRQTGPPDRTSPFGPCSRRAARTPAMPRAVHARQRHTAGRSGRRSGKPGRPAIETRSAAAGTRRSTATQVRHDRSASTIPIPPPTPRIAESRPMNVLTRCAGNCPHEPVAGDIARRRPGPTLPATSIGSDVASPEHPAGRSGAVRPTSTRRLPHRSPSGRRSGSRRGDSRARDA